MKYTGVALAIVAAAAAASPASAHKTHPPTPKPQTFTVQVGAQNPEVSAAINAFFPPKLVVHVGDSVSFVAGSSEMHNVNFGYKTGDVLPGFVIPAPADASIKGFILNPLITNPIPATHGAPVMYGGSGVIGSGILSLDFHSAPWVVTFNETGVFTGVCAVHGWSMALQVQVVNAKNKHAKYLAPHDVTMERHALVKLAEIDAIKGSKAILAQERPSVPLKNNATHHYVIVGGSQHIGAYDIDYNLFVPKVLKVNKGDVVSWVQSPTNMDVPHTVTFLNGNAQIATAIPAGPASNPMKYLGFNPAAAAPSAAVLAHTAYSPKSTAVFNSGVINPFGNFTMQIGNVAGNVQYECILHLSQGMVANITIA